MKVKLLLLPYCSLDADTGKPERRPKILPLGIAILTSFLRQHHFTVDQDDLSIKVEVHNETGARTVDMSVFEDEARVKQFLQQGQQDDLERVGKQILGLTSPRGYDVIGFSIMRADIPSPATIAMVLGKLIKEKHGSLIIIGGTIYPTVLEKVLSTG